MECIVLMLGGAFVGAFVTGVFITRYRIETGTTETLEQELIRRRILTKVARRAAEEAKEEVKNLGNV